MSINQTVKNEMAKTSNDPIVFTSKQIYKTIKELKLGKANGPDNIPTIAIKKLPNDMINLLTGLFNICITTGYFPRCWKSVLTIGIPKPGKDPQLVSSYRPIALSSVISRVFEKALNKELVNNCNIRQIIPDFQFGFRRQHSTEHALKLVYNYIRNGLDKKLTTGVLSFDIEKAFDRIWHEGLIYKMLRLHFPISLTKIIYSFIKDRHFKVKIGQSTSILMDTPFGVPQGSALSPTLYNIFIYDIPTSLVGDTKITNYADDTLIFTNNRNISVINKNLTQSTQIITEYMNKWKIGINKGKTSLTLYTNRRTKQLPNTALELGECKIEWTSSMKYLGVILDKRLTFNEEITSRINRFDKALRLIYPYICRNSHTNNNLKVHLYRTYLRPILTYSAPIINNIAATTLQRLEIKQNKCIRMMLNIPWESHTSSKEIRKAAGLPSLKHFLNKCNENFKNRCQQSKNRLIISLNTI